MEKPLPGALLLLLFLGCTAWADQSDKCRLGLYGTPQLDASEESPTCPGKTSAADPPAKETSRPWIRLGASAQEVTRSPSDPPEVGILLMEGEQCHKWARGKAGPVETFQCPTQHNQREEMFCCGTCLASYCCSSTKERLDQTSCTKVVRTEGQEPEEPAGPTVKNLNFINILEFIFLAAVLTTVFGVFFCSLRYCIGFLKKRGAQRGANAQPDLVRRIPATSVVNNPRPEWGVSALPDPPLFVRAESQRPSELPTRVANALWGNPIREVMKLPIFFLGGPLGVVPEEEKKEEEEQEQEQEQEKEEEGEGEGEEEETETVF